MARKKTIKDALVEEKVKTKKEEKDIDVVEDIDEDFDIDDDYIDDVKEDKKDNKEKESKKKEKEKKDGYFKQVSKELKKVVWPSVGDIFKYSLAVIIFCVLLCLFFVGIDLIASLIKGLF
jgi:preprotein translocase subunit SecE